MNSIKTIAYIATALLLASCQDLVFDMDSAEGTVSGFTINASYGDPKSKAVFDEDGLNLTWTPGDVLYLVDPEGVNPTVTLTTDITDSVKTARFHTDKLLPTGKYLVLFGQDRLDVDKIITISKDVADLNDQVRLYGEVDITMGDTEADVVLHHLFAMLSFKVLNIPGENASTISLGMAVGNDGLKNLGKGTIGYDGLKTEYSRGFQTFLGNVDGYKADDRGRTLIAPVDLRRNQVVFYCTFHDGTTRRVYTFHKGGIDIQAGKSYAITLDFDNATDVTIFEKSGGISIINDADDFLAAALLASGNSFIINNDIDFTEKLFLPLLASWVSGNGHTLSNILCNLNECFGVGVLSGGVVSDLHVKNSRFTGNQRVGAMVGSGSCHNCSCTDVTVTGTTEVGGLVGYANHEIDSCSIQGVSNINGVSHVGGVVGRISSSYQVKNCVAKGGEVHVSCGDKGQYAGGIAATAEGGVIECGFEGGVYGGTQIGGICGNGACTRCYCVGNVVGTTYVGGISGSSGCTDCYFIGELFSDPSSGAGISGANIEVDVTNCYSCITNTSTEIGICSATDAEYMGTNLTSLWKMYDSDSPSGNCGCGTAGNTFLDNLEVINGNEAYLPICWPENDAMCPLLAWQYEGFGAELTIPAFESVTW